MLNALRRKIGKNSMLRAITRPSLAERFLDADAATLEIIEKVRPFSMTSAENLWTTIKTVEYIEAKGIPGHLIEAGVWRGGQAMAMALTLKRLGSTRPIWLYDTFQGMPEPTASDVNAKGHSASERFGELATGSGYSNWVYASRADVERNLASVGYEHVRLIEGKVEETLAVPDNVPPQVALLRLDTDWYESTKAELEILYPLLSQGGVTVIDDYGSWLGARQAWDEYFSGSPVLMFYVDPGARAMIKY